MNISLLLQFATKPRSTLGEDQTRCIFWLLCPLLPLLKNVQIWNLKFQIWNRNSKSRAESRSRACSDTGRLLSAPVLTFYARHAPLLSAAAYQSVVFCIPQSIMHTILLYSNTWHAPLLSAGAYQGVVFCIPQSIMHSNTWYAPYYLSVVFCILQIIMHTILLY